MTAPILSLADLQACKWDAPTMAACFAEAGVRERQMTVGLLQNRMILGQLCLETKRREIWREMGCRSWMGFLTEEFPKLTGLEVRTAYDAMLLADSRTLQSMESLGAVPSLAHARQIAKRDRHGDPMTVEEISVAVAQPAANGTVAKVWTGDDERAKQLQRIMESLRQAGAPALQWLADLLESDAVQAYTCGSANSADFLLGVMTTCAWDEIRATYAHMVEELGPQRVAVLAQHHWRCVACGRFLSLQIHHIEFRSHGGGDEPDNLEPRCAACHEKIHGR